MSFAIGFFLGGFLGVFVMALANAASKEPPRYIDEASE